MEVATKFIRKPTPLIRIPITVAGQMDLVETKEIWSQKHHVMTRLFGGELTKPERPKEGDFMSAFLMGKQDA